jgi:hypothetical protein
LPKYEYCRYWEILENTGNTSIALKMAFDFMQFGQSIKKFLSITSIFQKVSVSAILVLPVFSRIFQYLQYSYFGND